MHPRTNYLAAVLAALSVLLFAGCRQDRLVWSPDGARAAIITKDGLHLCDADGRLTPLLAPGVYRAAWFADSQRLVLARSRGIGSYASLEQALGPVRSREFAARAEIVWEQWKASPKGKFDSPIEPADDIGAIVVYLREHHGDALAEKLAEDPGIDRKQIESMTADWHSLLAARVVGDRIEIGATLCEGLARVVDVRPAPDGRAVAFVAAVEPSPGSDDGLSVFVSPTDGSSAAVVVASHTAAHPDWSPDSRTIVYLRAAGDRAVGNDLQYGALVERGVMDADGSVRLAEKTRNLAGLLFQEQNRVRCLRDGRVLFDAAEFQLPRAGPGQAAREQLFALDRTKRDAVLTPLIPLQLLERLPYTLEAFEVSPDELEVLVSAGADADVLTLAGGTVEHLALGAYDDSKKNPPFPVWRRPGEIVYLKKGGPRNEVVLLRDGRETVLSRNWPDEVLERLAE